MTTSDFPECKTAVVVGRFQNYFLHQGHLDFFNEVGNSKYDNLVIVICSPVFERTKKNPLDFEMRKAMLKHRYKSATILHLRDCRSDHEWSDKLDIILESTGFKDMILFCSRDSFQKNYFGKNRVHVIPEKSSDNSAFWRNKVKSFTLTNHSQDFLLGAVYTTQNQYPRSSITCDIIAFKKFPPIKPSNQLLGFDIVLGKKKNCDKWCLPGGFVDLGHNLEQTARKELKEETNLGDADYPLYYIGSFNIKDWRLTEGESIVTALFACQITHSSADLKAGDDLDEVKWVSLYNFDFNTIVEEHVPLIKAFIKQHVPEFKEIKDE